LCTNRKARKDVRKVEKWVGSFGRPRVVARGLESVRRYAFMGIGREGA